MGRGVVKDRNNYWSGTQTFERVVVEDAVFLDGAAYDLSSGNVTFPNTLDASSVQAKDSSGVSIKTSDGTESMNITDSGNISFFDTPISSWGSDWRAVEGPTTTWLMSAEPSGNESHFVNHAYIDNEGWKYKTSNEIPIKSSYVDGIFSISSAEEGQVDDPLTWLQFFTVKSGSVGINISDPSGSLDARSFSTSLGTTVASANLDASKALFMYSGHDYQAPTLFWSGDLGMAFGTGYDYTTGTFQGGTPPTNYLSNQQTHLISTEGWFSGYGGPVSAVWDEDVNTYALFSGDRPNYDTNEAFGFSFTPSVGQGVHGRVIRALSLVSIDNLSGTSTLIRNFKFYGKNGPSGSGSFTKNLNPTDWTLLVEGDSTSSDPTSPDVFTFTENTTAYDHYMIQFYMVEPWLIRGAAVAEMGMYEDAGSSFTNLMQILPNGNVNVTNTLNATTLQEGNVDLSTRYLLASRRGTDVCELVNGVVPSYRMPPLAISETSVVADLAAKYALTTQRGDIVIVTGTNQTFIKLNDDAAPTDSGDWTELVPNAVVSVNGDTGPIVSLDTSQIAEKTNLYYTDERVDGRIAQASINTLKDVSLSLAEVSQTNSSIANKALRINGAGNGVDHTTFSLPVSNGTIGQVLTSDGTGNTAWAEPSTASTFLDLLDTPLTYSRSTDLSSISMPVRASSTRNGSPYYVLDNFGEVTSRGWEPDTDTVASDEFVLIDFGSEVIIDSISVEARFVDGKVAAKDFKVLGSTDGYNFTQIFPEDGTSYQQLVEDQSGPQVFDFTNNTPYRHIKVIFNGSWWYKQGYVDGAGGIWPTIDIRNLEFYQSLAGSYVKVNSTGNGLVFERDVHTTQFTSLSDTPSSYGTLAELQVPDITTVTASSLRSASEVGSNSPSYAFDGDGSTGWRPSLSRGSSPYVQHFLQVDFESLVRVNAISIIAFYQDNNLHARDFKVLGSTDGSNFTQIFPVDGTSYETLPNMSIIHQYEFTNDIFYRYIKVIFQRSYAYDDGNVYSSSNTVSWGYGDEIYIQEIAFFQYPSLGDSYVKVNSSENVLEFDSTYNLIRGTQTPDITSYNTTATILSHEHNVIFSSPSSQDIALTLPISQTDASLNEESRFYIKNTSASHRVIVRGLSATDHPQVERLDSNDTTASSGSFVLHPKESAVFQGYNFSGNYRVVSHYRDDLTEIVTSSISQTKSAKTFVCTATSAVTIDLLDYPFWPLNVPILFKNLSTQDLTLDPHMSTQVDGSSNSIVIPFGKSVAIQRVDISTLIIADDTRVGSGGSGVSDFVSLSDTPASFTGATLDLVRVNSSGTALEFVDTSTLGFAPSSHLQDTNNPHGITPAGIGAATTGALATTNTDLSNHLQDLNNPHGITAAGIGAATSNDLTTHTSNTTNPHGTTFLKLGDTPAAYSNGNAVRSTTSGFEFFNPRQDDLFVSTGAPSTSQTLDCNINNGNQVFYFTSSPTADVALVLTNLSLAQSHATTVVVVFNQGATPYKVTGVTIAGQSSLTLKWQGATNAGTANSLDVFSFTILATASNTYTVFGNVTSFT